MASLNAPSLNLEVLNLVSQQHTQPHYTAAVFHPCLETPSTSASASAPASQPASEAGHRTANAAPRGHYSASPDRDQKHSQPAPRDFTTFSLAEELVRMRTGRDVRSAMPLFPSDMGGPHAPPREARSDDMPTLANHPEPRASAPNDHPTVSTSSEEAAGLQSDVFSVDHTQDTVSESEPDESTHIVECLIPVPLNSSEAISRSAPTEEPPVAGFPTSSVRGSASGGGLVGQFSIPAVTSQFPPSYMVDELYDPTSPNFQMSRPEGIESWLPHSPLVSPESDTDSPCPCFDVVDPAFTELLEDDAPVEALDLMKYYAANSPHLCLIHHRLYVTKLTEAICPNAALPEVFSAYGVQAARQDFTHTQRQEDDCYALRMTGTGTLWKAVPRRKRASSLPGIYDLELDLPKKPRLNSDEPQSQERKLACKPEDPETNAPTDDRPIYDGAHDEAYRQEVLAEMAQTWTDKDPDDQSRGEATNRYIHAILSKCKQPNTDPRLGPVDISFMSGKEAAATVERGTVSLPIVTAGRQGFKWSGPERPISELFRRMEDLSRHVSVQIPSHNFDIPSYETKSLVDVRKRFMKGTASDDPWNILDLRSPLPPSILPTFLTGENCQVLPRIRDTFLMGDCAERTKASREEWNEWTNLLEWVLMSEGGHNTAPHMDSHGWSTWITIQEGLFGFGWLSRPTDREQGDWMADPLEYTGGGWRYVILRPGQTVFFPSGTVHFVFRLHAQQTLALGGHVLQWTALDRWVQVILYQLRNPNITNEDLGEQPLKYIRKARDLVDRRYNNSNVEAMGGAQMVCRFMALASEVEGHYRRIQAKKKKKKSRR